MGESVKRSPMAEQNHHQELPSPTPHQPIALAEDPLRGSPPPPQHQRSAIEACIAGHQRELEALLLENQRLTASYTALMQERSSAKQDLRHLDAISEQIKAEKDAELRAVLEKSVKVEAEFRALETFKADLTLVKDKIEKLKVENNELDAQLNAVNADLAKAKLKVKDMPQIRAEKEFIAQDIKMGRAALEVERNNRTINLEQGQEMEKKKLSMIQEIDRLRVELDNAKKRARAAVAAVPGVTLNQGLGYRPTQPSSGSVHHGGSSPAQNPVHQMVKKERLQAIAEEPGDGKDGSNSSSSHSPWDDPVQPAESQGRQEPDISVADSKSHQNKENVQQQVGNENPQIVLDDAARRFLRDMIVQAYLKGKAGEDLTALITPTVHTEEDMGESKRPKDPRMNASQGNQQGTVKRPAPPPPQADDCNKKRVKSDPKAPAQAAKTGATQARSYVCYNCGDPSHLRKDCDKPNRNCRNCGKNGHIAIYCRGVGKQKKKKNAAAVAGTKASANQGKNANAQLFQSKPEVV